MKELIHILGLVHEDRTGRTFTVEVYGTLRPDGLWIGEILFRPRDGSTPMLAADETEQSSRSSLDYWATGLTSIYLEGAFERAGPAPAGA
jgi:hypothetical protein